MGLASPPRVSRKAVAWWEAGSSYPTAEHLKQLIVLGVQQQAFPAGREAEEIRVLWRAPTHQKVLLDEAWLALAPRPNTSALTPAAPYAAGKHPDQMMRCTATQPKPAPRVGLGCSTGLSELLWREREQARLSQWIIEDRCRVVSVLGLGRHR